MNDVNRYEYFCQFCTSIRGADSYMVVGIDIAKDRHRAFFGTPRGKTLWRRLIFSNDLAGYRRLIEQTNELLSEHQLKHVVFGLEPTGNFHKPLGHWLIQNDQDVVLVAGKAVKDNRQLLDGRWDKNDTKDSANVADLIGQAKCQFYEHPETYLLELRNLLSLRKRLKKEEHSLKMRIRNSLVAKYFPEMDRRWAKCLAENLAIVRWYLDPRKIAATEFDEFVKRVTRTDRGNRQIVRLRAIYEAAKDSVGMPVDSAAIFEARMLVERLKQTQEQIAETMDRVEAVCKKQPGYALLITIPGFGPFISSLVLATLGAPYRFKSPKQVIRLAGLDLNAKRSGKTSDASVPVISKKGDSDLRYGLYQAALIASYHHESFRRMFNRMLEGRHGERGIKTKIRVKMAAKMLIIAWTMLKNNEPFDAARLGSKPDKQR
jgi:transposase